MSSKIKKTILELFNPLNTVNGQFIPGPDNPDLTTRTKHPAAFTTPDLTTPALTTPGSTFPATILA